MSDKKISQLNEKNSLELGDYTIIVDHNDNTTKKVQALVFKGAQGDTGAQGLPGVGWQRDSVNGFTYPSFLTDKIGIGTVNPTAKLGVVGDSVSYTSPDPTGVITFNASSFQYEGDTSYPNDGYTHAYRVYTYYDSPLGRVYSSSYIQSDYISDNAGADTTYYIYITWTEASGIFDGYRVLKYDDYGGYNWDAGWDVTANDLYDYNDQSTSGDTTPTSLSSYGAGLNILGTSILTGNLTQSGVVSMGYNGDFNINDQGSFGMGIGTATPGAYVEIGKCAGGWGAHLRFTRVGYNTVDVRMAGAPDGFIFRNFDTTPNNQMFSFRDSNDTHIWDLFQGGFNCFKGASNDNVYSVQIGGASSLRTVGKAYFATTVGIGEGSPTGILHIKNATLAEAKTYLNIYGGAINIGKLDTDSSGNLRMNLYNSAGNAKVHLDTAGVSYLTGGNFGVGISPSYGIDCNTDIWARRYLAVGTYNASYYPGYSSWLTQFSQADQVILMNAALATSDSNGRCFAIFAGAETLSRVLFHSNGTIAFGSGSASRDTYLSRSAANTFKIAGSFDGSTTAGNLVVTGNVSLGTVSQSARLTLPAGTATASTAPIKLTSGVNLTIPEAGTIEFDGTDFYLTI